MVRLLASPFGCPSIEVLSNYSTGSGDDLALVTIVSTYLSISSIESPGGRQINPGGGTSIFFGYVKFSA